jgi:excisionase family DNA binding protein
MSSVDESLSSKYLTAKQVAELLHVKERKIYELASAGDIPGTRPLGKWLFERAAIYAWLQEHGPDRAGGGRVEPPNVLLGSHEPLLEWALRESMSGLATFLDGSLDGLERFSRGEGVAAGLHLYDPETETWNVPFVRGALGAKPVVLVEWAWRQRGLIVERANPKQIDAIAALSGRRVIPRQETAGSQILLKHFLAKHLPPGAKVAFCKPARTENDGALAVLEGEADAAFGLQSVARQYRLDFVPIVRERFDILVWRHEWFEEPLQRLVRFLASAELRAKAETMTGYDISGSGTVHYNGD